MGFRNWSASQPQIIAGALTHNKEQKLSNFEEKIQFLAFDLIVWGLVAQWDYGQQIQVAVHIDEPTVDQIPLEAMNL